MADLLDEDLLAGLKNLTDDQIDEVITRLQAMKSGASKNEKGTPVLIHGRGLACNKCGSVNFKKSGRKDGRQRYKCKDCGATFSDTSGTVFSHSKLTIEQWRIIISGMIDNLSLAKIAKKAGISTSAVWNTRQKILSILLDEFKGQDDFDGMTEVDEYSVNISFRGKRDPKFFIMVLGRMPRHNRSRSEKIQYLKDSGLWEQLQGDKEFLNKLLGKYDDRTEATRNKVCILTGQDRSGHTYIKPVCLGSISSVHVYQNLEGRMDCDDILITDGSNAYVAFAEDNNIQHEKVKAALHAIGPYSLAHINSLHSKLNNYLSDNGIRLPATKYLELNLILFWWLQKNKDRETKELVEELEQLISSKVGISPIYVTLQQRPLAIDTKGVIPKEV